MDQETKGQERRLVVVTGGSSGIGLACADRFRRDDADVRVADVQDREHPVDISDEAAVEAFFAGLPSAPAVLVNAAGIGLGAHILDLDLATWRKVFAVNLDGAFLCLRAAARRMAAAGGGVIVNVTSVNDRVPMRTHAAYCSAKAALAMLTRVAALDLGASNIRVVAVAPGVIDTPLVTAALSIPRVRAAMQERTALGDAVGAPTDVANLVEFLASDRAGWITGETVTVDGGQSLLGFPDIAAIVAAAQLTASGDAS